MGIRHRRGGGFFEGEGRELKMAGVGEEVR